MFLAPLLPPDTYHVVEPGCVIAANANVTVTEE
jgi:hypothetical protein